MLEPFAGHAHPASLYPLHGSTANVRAECHLERAAGIPCLPFQVGECQWLGSMGLNPISERVYPGRYLTIQGSYAITTGDVSKFRQQEQHPETKNLIINTGLMHERATSSKQTIKVLI